MKNSILLICAFATSQLLNAAVHTVSNEPGYPAQYTTIADAIAAASAGDTLLITGSATNYGNVTVNKQLTLIGVGYNPPGVKTSLENIRCTTGSSGSKFIGLYLNSWFYPSYVTANSNILIERCQIFGTQPGEAIDGLIIKNCVIDNGIYMSSSWTNVLITNNLIKGNVHGGTSPSVLISNNVFSNSGSLSLYSIQYAVVSNNIFYGSAPSQDNYGVVNCAFNNNISFGSADNDLPPTGGNNVGSGNMVGVDPLFVNVPNYSGNLSYDYHLQASSPGKNAGTDGTDIGIYGGSTPLVGALDGVPRLPLVTTFNLLNSSIGLGGSLNVHVEGRKHD